MTCSNTAQRSAPLLKYLSRSAKPQQFTCLHSREGERRTLPMTKVFIGGSRRLSRLNKDVKRRLDNIIERGFTVVVGDANGADKAVQQYLASRRYQKVIVFCMAGD